MPVDHHNEEIWKQVPGYEMYRVSNLGRIYSVRRKIVCRLTKRRNGYLQFNFKVEKRARAVLVHRVVLMAFIGESRLDCNHKNGVRDDNRLENLEYCTRSENILHGYHVTGNIKPRSQVGAAVNTAKLSDESVVELRKKFDSGINVSALASEFGVSWDAANRAARKLSWKHVG